MRKNINNLIQTVLPLGNCSEKEYSLVADNLQSLAPCNALYFGVGHDSKIWDMINAEGNNLFLDNLQEWIDKTSPTLKNSKIEKVEYYQKNSMEKNIQRS